MTASSGLATLQASDAVVAWCLRSALRRERGGDLEQAGIWGYVAAATAVHAGHSWLCSQPLEILLSRIGQSSASRGSWASEARREQGVPRRWLHVFTLTSGTGGHTTLARRWIARNPHRERHDVVVTGQPAEAVEPRLASAARASGGAVQSIAGVPGLLARAAALRAMAGATADVVVLHVHMWDVLPALAFAPEGGPVVLLMNHADHAFWTGMGVADAVLDFRESGLALTRGLRGARGSLMLPVPLDDAGAAPRDRSAVFEHLRGALRPDPAGVLLTIGRAAKYIAQPGLDFVACAGRILALLPDWHLVAVGPAADEPMWRALAHSTGGRVVAVGEQADLAPWHAAADVYLEGFPVGSYTALLEAALAQRAIVRKPWLAPPQVLPIDRGALAAFHPPPDADAYVAAAVALARDDTARATAARQLREAVRRVHAGTAWDSALDAMCAQLPSVHASGVTDAAPPPMPAALCTYSAALHAGSALVGPKGPLAFAEDAAHAQGLRPRHDVELLDALRASNPASTAR